MLHCEEPCEPERSGARDRREQSRGSRTVLPQCGTSCERFRGEIPLYLLDNYFNHFSKLNLFITSNEAFGYAFSHCVGVFTLSSFHLNS